MKYYPMASDAISQYTSPCIYNPASNSLASLKPRLLRSDADSGYNEAWLQKTLFEQPGLLPINEIEPTFGTITPVCRELGVPVGFLDLLYVNEKGMLTLVECKLWRNPGARRQVVGQILDYAQELSRWSYEDLERAVQASSGGAPSSLWAIAQKAFELTDEAAFIDGVSRCLRMGTFLLLVVGDGIRESTENIGAYLQSRTNLGFTFGLVEERFFELEDGRLLIQPRVLAKTTVLGRYIVQLERGTILNETLTRSIPSDGTRPRLTEALFIEENAEDATTADDIGQLFHRIRQEGFNLQPTARAASLKVTLPNSEFNVMTLLRNGRLQNHGCGNTVVGQEYLAKLACLLPEATVRTSSDQGWSDTVISTSGAYIPLKELIRIQDQWFTLLKDVQAALKAV